MLMEDWSIKDLSDTLDGRRSDILRGDEFLRCNIMGSSFMSSSFALSSSYISGNVPDCTLLGVLAVCSTKMDVEKLILSYTSAWGLFHTAFRASSSKCSANASMIFVIETNDIDIPDWWRTSIILHEAPVVHARSSRPIWTLQEESKRR